MANYEKVFPFIEVEEGGYQNNSSDTANYCDGKLIGTNRGISAIQYKDYFGKCPTIADIKGLSQSTAKRIWKDKFWTKIDGDKVPSNSLAELYLYSIGGGNSGYLHIKQSANKVAGKKLFAEDSSILTKDEMSKINRLNTEKMFNTLYLIRKKFYQNNPKKTFRSGWLNRLEQIKLRFDMEKIKSPLKGVALPITLFGVGVIILGVYLYKKYV